MELLKAFWIMLRAHKGQKDKSGKPYVFHPITVMLGVKGRKYKTIALLHDVLEDSALYTMKDFDFLTSEQKEALLLLTHDKGVPYFEYIERIKTNDIARQVKISDLKHNSNLKRLKEIRRKDIKRLIKYTKAGKLLMG